MKTFAIINESGLVINTLCADTHEIAQEIAELTNESYSAIEYFMVEPGWSYIDSQWVKPTE